MGGQSSTRGLPLTVLMKLGHDLATLLQVRDQRAATRRAAVILPFARIDRRV